MKGAEALSIASSIATLTGVSFTWLATVGGFGNASAVEIAFKSVSAIIAVLVSIGVTFLVVRTFAKVLEVTSQDNRVYVWTFGLAFAIFIGAASLGAIAGCAYFFWEVHY
ncbi:hypothetical protein ACIPI6_00005 [Pseudomonas protegens]|uniref:hypothetical protein n=1 Tax=Pseudomonas protegens TaxID=380021 RepID=UPI003829AA5A